MKNVKLTREEKTLQKDMDKGEYVSIPKGEWEKHIASAKEFLRKKDARITIRLNSQDVRALKTEASREGLPYQTLIGTILHKYIAARLGMA